MVEPQDVNPVEAVNGLTETLTDPITIVIILVVLGIIGYLGYAYTKKKPPFAE